MELLLFWAIFFTCVIILEVTFITCMVIVGIYQLRRIIHPVNSRSTRPGPQMSLHNLSNQRIQTDLSFPQDLYRNPIVIEEPPMELNYISLDDLGRHIYENVAACA